ncbi:MAG: DUF6279 family lipoprotein [Halioglobus sp.]
MLLNKTQAKRGSGRWSLLICLLLLNACSSTTFIYNRLDFLLPWYLGGYMDLSRPQKEMLDDLLQPYLYWHRTEELPLYLTVLEQVESDLDGPLTLEQVAATSLAFEEAWLRLEQESLNWMLSLGEDLSDQQMTDFIARLQEQQLEYEEEYLPRSDEDYREETYEGLLESFQDFMGKLDPSQVEVLNDTAEAMLRSDAAWLAERAAWLLRLEATLQREPGWEQGIRDAIASRDEDTSEQYRQVYLHNVERIQLAIVEVANSRSDKQDKHLRRKLTNLQKDLRTLIEQGHKMSQPQFPE